ncbi:potassium channel family protein [Candidatus Micrarchaeota archaeon]|nr:potassium channel family protein [Candidatus Micrarchaeota archaeon]MBU1166128.1 potassium channel family protein [Candidatus Micrarchaeota archaeon]MBU1887329.1 potassium channel family protein [Candidatus Micrarchaeota archaeon]
MQSEKLYIPLALLLTLYLISIIFFHYVEGWNYIDAAYFTTATIATVGYGDITPVTDIGKLGVIVLIFLGISIGFYVITSLGDFRKKNVDPHIQKRIETLRRLADLPSRGTSNLDLKKLRKKVRDQDY